MTPRQALQILALSSSADLTPTSVKKAYLQQTLRCHPDLHPHNPKATEDFRSVSDAFRVVLKVIEARRCREKGTPIRSGSDDSALYDAQAALESLRRAILMYQEHKQEEESANEVRGEVPCGTASDAFFTPSLEYVSSICQREARAMRRVHIFCTELPVVLCGSKAAALFEAVAFFHTRYVESMSACVLRFSKNLPIIVRRVVKNRRRHVREGYSPLASGIGTGSRPRIQRLEDLGMKPLVLVGALLFEIPDRSADAAARDGASGALPSSNRSHTVSGSTCGVSNPQDVRISEELRCTIHPSDTIADIVEKLGKWEAASYERLKLELAIVDANALLSDMLGIHDDCGRAEQQFAVQPHLEETSSATEVILRTVQKLATELCHVFDSAMDSEVSEEVINAMSLEGDWDNAASRKDDEIAVNLPLPLLVAQSRRLVSAARPMIRGNIILTWSDSADLAQETTELATVPESAGPFTGDYKKHHVARHASCSTAESILFSVSVELTKDLRVFLLRLRHVLKRMLQAANASKRLLFELLPLRESVLKEEFIPLSAAKEAVDAESPELQYRYRSPIHCLPRVCNMSTAWEYELWKLAFAHREYLAAHSVAMNPINIFFECIPYDISASDRRQSSPSQSAAAFITAGWVGDGPDGCDSAIVTSQELGDPVAFKAWLEEVVEQSSLNREAEKTLADAGVGYVTRDPELPLAQYLSFVKLFIQSSAVRSVLERSHSSANGAATAESVGLSIIVCSDRCDVRDGGQLFIPWYMDPSILLALLGDSATPCALNA